MEVLYHTLNEEETLKALKCTKQGLTSYQAEQRLHKYGFNELQVEHGISPVKIFFQQFTSPLVWILLTALLASIFLHETFDAVVIAVIVMVNAVLGFVQEYRAERAIEALKKLTSLKAKVVRNKKQQHIASRMLVPGDIIVLETGDKVPADARLLEISNFQTQEGALTGESQPVTKRLSVSAAHSVLAERMNMVYASTIVSKGRARAVVTGTGNHSEVGKIAKLIAGASEQLTPLQVKLRDLGKYLTIAVVAVALVVFLAGILGGQSWSVMFITAIALAVAAIPEGLPAVITIALAVGIQAMAKRNALVRKLPSVETLGSVTVICSDKTGTLTHNEMTVTRLWTNNEVYEVTGSGYSAEGHFAQHDKKIGSEKLESLLAIGLHCNDASFEGPKDKRKVLGDPTEAALLVAAHKAGVRSVSKRVDEIPFSSERKMMTTLHQTSKGVVSYTKGAPDILLHACNRILIHGKVVRLTRNKVQEILGQNEEFAKNALRVLGFAYNEKATVKTAEKDMIFVGLQAMIDPPRCEVKDAISRCHKAGIRVIMITGDQLATAQAIAADLGITGEAVAGVAIEKLNLAKDIKKIGIFARVNPEHKLRIVEVLKKQGHVVAMTGDGVNDAPALKKADIGVAMGISGTDVAKEASDMILADDNFESIVNAIEEGRGIFDNIRKFVNYLLSSNLGEIVVILLASVFGLPLPLTAIQILWVNLVTDGLPATALAVDPHGGGLMDRPPRPPRESILSKELRWDIILFGVLIGVGTLILFWLYQGSGLIKAQTIAFTALVLFELVRLYTIRMHYKLSLLSNKWLVAAVVFSVLLQLTALYTPLSSWFKTTALGLVDWGVLLLSCAVLYVVYVISFYLLKKVVHIKHT